MFALGLLTGCGGDATTPATPSTTSVPTAEALEARDIDTIDDGIDWARSLDASVGADELGAGVRTISDMVPDLDISASANNKIGAALISLNAAILAAPDDASTKADDLNAIVDDIEKAIAAGPNG